MAFVHGQYGKLLMDEWDVSPYFNSVNIGKEAQAVDVTSFANSGVRSYLAGLESGSFNTGGMYDPVATAADPDWSASLGSEAIVTFLINDYTTIGQPAAMLKCERIQLNSRADIEDAVRVQLAGEVDGGVRFGGVILHPLTAETTTANFTSVDNTTSSAFGGVAHLHVTAFTGTSGTLKVQHSTDNSVWADLITFTNVTAVGSQRSTVTGTVNRYVRAIISADTFTTMTFLVAFARNKQ